MGFAIATVNKSGGDDTHYKFLAALKTLAEANGWTTLRSVSTGLDRELIMVGEGLSGTEEIYVGVKCYQNVSADYYNLAISGFTGYVSGNTFEAQPGANIVGVPAHNNSITYFVSCNAQRIAMCLKVGTPVYSHGYIGKMLPYARPGEYPMPLVSGGMFEDAAARRFSDQPSRFPYRGLVNTNVESEKAHLFLRDQAGNWNRHHHYPFSNGNDNGNGSLAGQYLEGYRCMVPTGTNYQLEPIMLYATNGIERSNVWGELDGIFYCTGFNNGSENVLQIGGSSVVNQTGQTVLQSVNAIHAVGGRAFVILQDLNRTTWRDFIAMEMTA